MFEPNLQRTQTERTGDISRPFQFNRTQAHEDRIISHCARVASHFSQNEPKTRNVIKSGHNIHIRAFFAAYKLLKDLSPEERFLTAICQTSDDMFKKADKARIEQWELEYG